MERKKIGIPIYQKVVKACPKSLRTQDISCLHAYRKLDQRWNFYRSWSFALVLAIIAGIFMILAGFLPPVLIVQLIIAPSGIGDWTSDVTAVITPITLVSSLLPFVVSFLLGISSARLIPLFEPLSGRHRLYTGLTYGLLFSVALWIDMVKLTLWILINGPLFSLPPLPEYTILFTLSPSYWLVGFAIILVSFGTISTLITVCTAFFSEYLWNFFRSTVTKPAPRISGSSIYLKSGIQSTVLNIEHKGGYIRGFAKPSKWQPYSDDPAKLNIEKL